MSIYQISSTPLQQCDGHPVPLLLDDDVPDPFAAAYAINHFSRGDSFNSIETQMRQILVLYRFLISKDIDFHQRMSTLRGFNHSEIQQFSTYCTLNFREDDRVRGGTYKLRVNQSWYFILYWFKYFQRRAQNNTAIFNQATEVKNMMALSFQSISKVPGLANADKKGLQPDLKEKFFEIISPDSSLNPWKQERVRWRNYVMLLLYILSGNRRGEQLLLEVTDFELDGPKPSFAIKHRDRALYPRKSQPAIKTKGRIVALSTEMATILTHYIVHIRSQFSGANKSPYLFLSAKDGGPLALSTVNAILDTLKEKHPEYKSVLSPHRLRNTFHDMLESELQDNPLSSSPILNAAKKQAVQTYADGWSPTSVQPQNYAKGERERTANKLQRKIQSDKLKHQPSKKE